MTSKVFLIHSPCITDFLLTSESVVHARHYFVSHEKMIEKIENPDSDQTEEQRDEIITDTRKVAQCVLDGNRYQGIGHMF